MVGPDPDCKDTCLPSVQKIGIEEMTNHPNFQPSNYIEGFDIALIRLKEPAKLSLVSIVKKILVDIVLSSNSYTRMGPVSHMLSLFACP